MRDNATPRNLNFIIIQQNAASLIDGHPKLGAVIDAIAQEAIWIGSDADVDQGNSDGYDWPNDQDLAEYYLGYLWEYQDAILPVFDCEYALEDADDAHSNAFDEGFIPYGTRRSLSKQITTPPPGFYLTLGDPKTMTGKH